MSIENMTIAEAREIARLFSAATTAPNPHPMVGEYVILRCFSAGVHAGILVSQTGDEAVLKDARRLWSWTANGGIALSGLAIHGLKSGKVDTVLPKIALTGVIETIPCSQKAQETINGA